MDAGTAGNVEHGDQYQLKLVYEHNLQRTACNMTYGTFGGVTGSCFTCAVSETESQMLMPFLQGSLLYKNSISELSCQKSYVKVKYIG